MTLAAAVGDHAGYEALLRRPTRQNSSGRPGWEPQIRARPPLWFEPLLHQVLPQDSPAGSIAGTEEGKRKATEDRRGRAHKLLEEDVQERPAATASERCRFLECTTGKSLSDSTVKRLLKRLVFSQKMDCGGDGAIRMAKDRLEGDGRPRDRHLAAYLHR